MNRKQALNVTLILIAAAFVLWPNNAQEAGMPTPALSPVTTKFKPADPEVKNPDGTRTLSVKTAQQTNGTKTYTFFVKEETGQRTLLAQTVEATTSYAIPANTWSPGDNTYIFLEEKSTPPAGGRTRFLVLKTSAQPFSEEERYLDVTALFAQTPNKYRIHDVTGWDAPQLLHVRTVTDEGVKGPSFWFDVESRVFLQLAS